MPKLIAKRLIILIPQLLFLSLLLFFLTNLIPAGAYFVQLNIDPRIPPEKIEELRVLWGYYDPWLQRYIHWLGNAVQGNFGDSFYYRIPVTTLITQRAANSFWLVLMSVIFTYLVAVPLGIISGRYHDKLPDRLITIYSYLAMATPVLMLSLLAILFFSFRLRWFPFGGSVSVEAFATGSLSYVVSRLYHMILPALTMALVSTATIIQFLRSEIIDHEQSDFVAMAKSKGVPQRLIYSKHIFRNSMLPIASSIGNIIVTMLSASIFVETIFNYPGMGLLLLHSIREDDRPVAYALVLLYVVLSVAATLLTEIIVSVVDPRIAKSRIINGK